MRTVLVVILVLGTAAVVVIWALGQGALGRFDSETLTPVEAPRSAGSIVAGLDAQRAAAAAVGIEAGDRQILFGDLHAHTTISFDAFMLNMPLLGGSGAAPPADACDFARHCAALDFWSINDHSANITAVDWRNTIESIRQCNQRAGDPDNPDLVSFLGYEWTQAGKTPATHYGHKNVVLKQTDDANIPTRPIAASAGAKICSSSSCSAAPVKSALIAADGSSCSSSIIFALSAAPIAGTSIPESCSAWKSTITRISSAFFANSSVFASAISR